MRGLTFSGSFQKSRKDAKQSGRVIVRLEPAFVGSYILSHPLSQCKASRQGAPGPQHVDLYPLWIRGQTEKCKFWQLPLWALTSQDSFSPRPHPGSDFPHIRYNLLTRVVSLPDAEGIARHNFKQSTTRVNAMNWITISSRYQPCPGWYFFPPSSLIFEDAGGTNHLQTFPIVSLLAPNKGKAPLSPAWPRRPHNTFPPCLVASNLLEIFVSSVTWC